jgi:23S rRNA (pseudouridine1915-N3)-methyltransferase
VPNPPGMHVRLVTVGKLREPYLVAAAADFRQRLRSYHRLEEIEIRARDGSDAGRAMAAEAEAILKQIARGDHVWLLERTGTEFSSLELAQRLDALPGAGISQLTLVVAGTYGAAPELLERAQVRWSLSKLTLLHEWARVLVLEQLYRAAKIATNEPYHH